LAEKGYEQLEFNGKCFTATLADKKSSGDGQ
jgi:hypothetical protein